MPKCFYFSYIDQIQQNQLSYALLIIKLDIKMKKVIQYNPNANIDKSNRSVISRSSKLTKKNPEQQNQQLFCPYFKRDKVGDKVLQRSLNKTLQQKTNTHLDRVGKIIEDLMSRHKKAKEKLQKLKQQTQKQQSRQCTFAPVKNKLQRYQVTGDVIRRSEIWLRQKKRKELDLKESITMQKLKQYTFSPNFESKKKSLSYLKSRSSMRVLTPRSRFNEKSIQNSCSPSIKTQKRDYTSNQYEIAKRNLISKMMNILE